MAVGITDHGWTMQELLPYHVPMPRWVPRSSAGVLNVASARSDRARMFVTTVKCGATTGHARQQAQDCQDLATLEARGIARQWLDRVHAPIGLNIHARSPEEISISILAELIHVRRTSPVVIPQRQRLSLSAVLNSLCVLLRPSPLGTRGAVSRRLAQTPGNGRRPGGLFDPTDHRRPARRRDPLNGGRAGLHHAVS